MQHQELLQIFTQELPRERFLSDAADLSFYGVDSGKDYAPSPSLIFLPHTTEEVSTFLKICNARAITVVPSGGRTGYSGGATAANREVVLSLERMNKIIDISVEAQTITCQAGVKTQTIIEEGEKHGLFYGVDFSSKGSSHIGGNIATNAGGIRVIRYGNTRQWVLGLTVVLADGTVLRLNGELIKNQTGYDMRHLFIGSEGTLGVVVEAVIKLEARPKESALALCAFNDEAQLLSLLGQLKQNRYTINVFEYFDAACLALVTSRMSLRSPFTDSYSVYGVIEIEIGNADDRDAFEKLLLANVEGGSVQDVVVAQNGVQAQELMALREKISECIGKHHIPHKNDISVPVRFIPAFVHEFRASMQAIAPEVKMCLFGHIGDGNLHLNLLKPEEISKEIFLARCKNYDEATFKIVERFTGSISAEHGVGLLKRDFLHYSRSQSEIDLMKGIKKVFDPKGILNPGKLLPTA